MSKTVIDIDDEALADAAEILGTRTKKDTVNAALRETGARARRRRALEELTRMAEDGAFDALLGPPPEAGSGAR
ncbi:type II toxin-antitoxin system VapB family antitoxin [Streptomyces sp. 6N223]|uniref:type II toxin-antitoxin system VapB family antitoxin n=1 Tax=Streptomyces sp. 6N223 TaxID=3457412 RepID=UPI003FD03B6F